MSRKRTFSESWHKVANIKASLLSTVKSHKQLIRGHWWYVLNDPYNNLFFRVPIDAYHFIAKLNYQQTIDQVWQHSLENDPENTPGQEEIIQLLTQLHHNNLLHYDSSSNNAKLFERQEKLKRKQFRAKLMGFMFMKVPLFDPDNFIRFMLPAFKPFFGIFGIILWLSVIIFAGKELIDNMPNFISQTQLVFSPDNIILLYLSMAFIKTLHEFGHTIVCRYYGGEVRTMGVMLILFTPLPYMDATSSWSFRKRWQRAFVGAAGMIVEIFIAAIAVMVWANTGQGTVNSLAYNMIFVASVSTILFNANPLLRFDGYYILSDLIDIPNLYQRSRSQLTYIIERYIYRCKNVTTFASSHAESYQLIAYGILSIIYRVLIFVGIILFVADQYLILGLLMAVLGGFLWLVLPPFKVVKYLVTNKRISRRRKPAALITASFFTLLLLALTLIPMPNSFRVSGIIEANNNQEIFIETDGFIDEIFTPSGKFVNQGAPLFKLKNSDLNYQLKRLKLRQLELREKINQARKENVRALATLNKQYASLSLRMSKLRQQISDLTVIAGINGIWSAPELSDKQGSWKFKGEKLGTIINDDTYRFAAIVLQDDNSKLFQQGSKSIDVRIVGQEQHNLALSTFQIIPFQQDSSTNKNHQTLTQGLSRNSQEAEPIFQLFAELPKSDLVAYQHGVAGILKVGLDSKPLLQQWTRLLRQLIQKRYQL